MPVSSQDQNTPTAGYGSAQQVAQSQGISPAGGTPLGPNNLQVYFGTQTFRGTFPAGYSQPFRPLDIAPKYIYASGRNDILKSLQEAQGMIFQKGIYNRLVKEAADLGIGHLNPTSAATLWQNMIEFSAQAREQGYKISPWGVLKLYGRAARAGGGGGGGPFSGTKTMTASSVDLTDPKTAKALLDQTLANAIGRQATAREVKAFVSALNAEEEQHPTIATTSTTYEAGIPVSSSTTTKGGFPAEAKGEFAEERAQQHKEYGAYQVAVPFMNALLEMLDSG